LLFWLYHIFEIVWGRTWFRRVIEGVESMPSVYQVLVKQLVKNVSAEDNSSDFSFLANDLRSFGAGVHAVA